MPDTNLGPYQFDSFRELSRGIKDILQMMDMPACLFNEVRIRKLWAHVKRYGSSSAHFHLYHKGYALSFTGLTEEEYEQAASDDNWY